MNIKTFESLSKSLGVSRVIIDIKPHPLGFEVLAYNKGQKVILKRVVIKIDEDLLDGVFNLTAHFLNDVFREDIKEWQNRLKQLR